MDYDVPGTFLPWKKERHKRWKSPLGGVSARRCPGRVGNVPSRKAFAQREDEFVHARTQRYEVWPQTKPARRNKPPTASEWSKQFN